MDISSVDSNHDNSCRIVIVDETGTVINAIRGPANYVDPTVHATYVSDDAQIGAKTLDGGKTFFASASAPTLTEARLLAYASDKQTAILGQMWSFDLGTSAAPLILTTRLDTSGQNAMLKLSIWAINNANTGALEAYSNVDYTGADLTARQVSLLAIKAGGIVSQTFSLLNDLAAKVISGAITTTAEIDAASWPDNSVTR